jgi:hypothetical protein
MDLHSNMKPKKRQTKRASSKSHRVDRVALNKHERELEVMAKAYLRDANIRAAGTAPVRQAIASKFPWIAQASKKGYENAKRLLDGQPAIPRRPEPFTPPGAGSVVPLPAGPSVVPLFGCSLKPFNHPPNLTNYHGQAVNADPSGFLYWKGEADGTEYDFTSNALGRPGVAIDYEVTAPGILNAHVIATVNARAARLSEIFFGKGASALLQLEAHLEVDGIGMTGGSTDIINWPYPSEGQAPWGYDSLTITSQNFWAGFRWTMTSSGKATVWGQMYAYVAAAGLAAAQIECSMTIQRICVYME